MPDGSDEVIIIENGNKPTWLKVYLNNGVPQSVRDKLNAIAEASKGHISKWNKVRLFRLLWNILP